MIRELMDAPEQQKRGKASNGRHIRYPTRPESASSWGMNAHRDRRQLPAFTPVPLRDRADGGTPVRQADNLLATPCESRKSTHDPLRHRAEHGKIHPTVTRGRCVTMRVTRDKDTVLALCGQEMERLRTRRRPAKRGVARFPLRHRSLVTFQDAALRTQ